MRDQAVGLAVGLVLGAILIVPLFGLVRRLEAVGGVGRNADHRCFCIREPDRSGLHFATIQSV